MGSPGLGKVRAGRIRVAATEEYPRDPQFLPPPILGPSARLTAVHPRPARPREVAAGAMSTLVISTACGEIKLALRPDAAPETVKYISKLVSDGVYNGCTFYRSDFVIQCGLHPHKCPVENLKVNETPLHTKISNTRGTAAIAHWDVPDCGNSEFFINLGSNAHLDSAYGGYCVFAVRAGPRSRPDRLPSSLTREVRLACSPAGSRPVRQRLDGDNGQDRRGREGQEDGPDHQDGPAVGMGASHEETGMDVAVNARRACASDLARTLVEARGARPTDTRSLVSE